MCMGMRIPPIGGGLSPMQPCPALDIAIMLREWGERCLRDDLHWAMVSLKDVGDITTILVSRRLADKPFRKSVDDPGLEGRVFDFDPKEDGHVTIKRVK